MSFELASSLSLRSSLRALLLLLLFWWPLTIARAQDVVRLTLDITVTDKNGKPVPQAEVLIPRQGKNAEGQSLDNIKTATNSNGKLVRDNTDFDLTGPAHEITVTAPEFTQPLKEELPHDKLRNAFKNQDGRLVLKISPHSDPPKIVTLTISGKVIGTDGNPLPNAQISIPRRGEDSDGKELKEIYSGGDGKFSTTAVFHLDGTPHKLTVTASGFEPVDRDLTDEDLRRGAGQTVLTLEPITLGTQSRSPSIFQSSKDIFKYAIWGLGLPVLVWLLWRLWRDLNKRRQQRNYDRQKQAPAGGYPNTSSGAPPAGTAAAAAAAPSGAGKGFNESEWGDTVKAVFGIKQDMLTKAEFQREISELKAFIIEQRPPAHVDEKGGVQSGASESLVDQAARGAASFPSDTTGAEPLGPSDDGALVSYRNLIGRLPVTPEPIYLNVEGARSIAGKLEDDNVYLSQVNHSQGAFVLFTNSNKSGWLFPNPTLAFRQAALKDVFPALTQTEFDASKEDIKPKRAKKVEEGRWMVEQ